MLYFVLCHLTLITCDHTHGAVPGLSHVAVEMLGEMGLWRKASGSVWWLDEESCLQCHSLSRCPMQEAELQPMCSLMDVQMWLWAVENKRLISEAFEVLCLSYASISSPAIHEMWKRIWPPSFWSTCSVDSADLLCQHGLIAHLQFLREMNCIWKSEVVFPLSALMLSSLSWLNALCLLALTQARTVLDTQ